MLRELRQFFQRRAIAVHGENAFGRDHGMIEARPVLMQQLLGMRDIVVPEKLHVGAAEFGPAADAGMRKLVAQDEIAAAGNRRQDPGIGEIARAEHASGLRALELRQPRFEFGIERMVAGDEARGAGAHAEAADRLDAASFTAGCCDRLR